MPRLFLLALVTCAAALHATPAAAQEQYGARGLFPVYESSDQWVVFDKRQTRDKNDRKLSVGSRMLVVGSAGAELFEIARASGTFGSICRKNKPVKVRAALLKGPRRAVGRPIIGIAVNPGFSLKGSRAVYRALPSKVGEETYARLLEPLKKSTLEDVTQGAFRFKLDDGAAEPFLRDPKPEAVQIKIDFGAELAIKGLPSPYVFVEETQISASSRRCLRLNDGQKLIGGCAEMPRALMAETDLLQFVAYDPSGGGTPFLLAFTKSSPMWGDERWGFVLRATGPKLFLMDALDVRCREAF